MQELNAGFQTIRHYLKTNKSRQPNAAKIRRVLAANPEKTCSSEPYFLIALISLFQLLPYGLTAQSKSIILGRPTDTSITASIMFDQNAEFYLEYGIQPGVYVNTTSVVTCGVNTPLELDLSNLTSNTQYFYRMQYRFTGALTYTPTPEYTFHTQRSAGSNYTFTIEADEHLYDKKGVKNMYNITLSNQAADHPDFMLSLGDIFGDDHEPFTITSGALDSLHRDYRPFLGSVCHSIPFYVCLGNHEGENDFYYAYNPPDNLCVWGTQWRKYYYPNPYPNNFYSGNTTYEPYGIGNPENYYAWTWGDALFVVLDVYRDQCDTSAKPKNWDWTLGAQQYSWLQSTLQNSTALYKFVFAHHISGQGRGGITNAKLYEWGGYDGPNGNTYSFPAQRPGWTKPIHQLFKDYGVNIFFQGHDHVFAHEVMDGVTYQAVPMAADSTYEIGKLANADAYTADTLDGTGHIRVSVSPQCVQVDFVRAYLPADTVGGIHQNREVAFSYSIGNCAPAGTHDITKKSAISIAPNPARDLLSIQQTELQIVRNVKLMNLYGQLILESLSANLDISRIPNGLYVVSIETDTGIICQKLVIQH